MLALALASHSLDTKELDRARCLEDFPVFVKTWDWMNISERDSWAAEQCAAAVARWSYKNLAMAV